MALAFIGLRPSEIKGLKREDIDLSAGVLRVCRSAWHSSINEGGKGKNSVRDVTLGSTVVSILRAHMETERSQRGFLLENSLGMPLDLDALARDVIRPMFAASGLEWKGYYGGRRGAETEMNRYTNGNSQITAHHFGHTKAVADAHYIKPIPEETKIAALALDSTLRETIGNRGSGRIECKLMCSNRPNSPTPTCSQQLSAALRIPSDRILPHSTVSERRTGDRETNHRDHP